MCSPSQLHAPHGPNGWLTADTCTVSHANAKFLSTSTSNLHDTNVLSPLRLWSTSPTNYHNTSVLSPARLASPSPTNYHNTTVLSPARLASPSPTNYHNTSVLSPVRLVSPSPTNYHNANVLSPARLVGTSTTKLPDWSGLSSAKISRANTSMLPDTNVLSSVVDFTTARLQKQGETKAVTNQRLRRENSAPRLHMHATNRAQGSIPAQRRKKAPKLSDVKGHPTLPTLSRPKSTTSTRSGATTEMSSLSNSERPATSTIPGIGTSPTLTRPRTSPIPGIGSSQTLTRPSSSTIPPGIGGSQTLTRPSSNTIPPGIGSSQTRTRPSSSTIPPGIGSSQTLTRPSSNTIPPGIGSSQTLTRPSSNAIHGIGSFPTLTLPCTNTNVYRSVPSSTRTCQKTLHNPLAPRIAVPKRVAWSFPLGNPEMIKNRYSMPITASKKDSQPQGTPYRVPLRRDYTPPVTRANRSSSSASLPKTVQQRGRENIKHSSMSSSVIMNNSRTTSDISRVVDSSFVYHVPTREEGGNCGDTSTEHSDHTPRYPGVAHEPELAKQGSEQQHASQHSSYNGSHVPQQSAQPARNSLLAQEHGATCENDGDAAYFGNSGSLKACSDADMSASYQMHRQLFMDIIKRDIVCVTMLEQIRNAYDAAFFQQKEMLLSLEKEEENRVLREEYTTSQQYAEQAQSSQSQVALQLSQTTEALNSTQQELDQIRNDIAIQNAQARAVPPGLRPKLSAHTHGANAHTRKVPPGLRPVHTRGDNPHAQKVPPGLRPGLPIYTNGDSVHENVLARLPPVPPPVSFGAPGDLRAINDDDLDLTEMGVWAYMDLPRPTPRNVERPAIVPVLNMDVVERQVSHSLRSASNIPSPATDTVRVSELLGSWHGDEITNHESSSMSAPADSSSVSANQEEDGDVLEYGGAC